MSTISKHLLLVINNTRILFASIVVSAFLLSGSLFSQALDCPYDSSDVDHAQILRLTTDSCGVLFDEFDPSLPWEDPSFDDCGLNVSGSGELSIGRGKTVYLESQVFSYSYTLNSLVRNSCRNYEILVYIKGPDDTTFRWIGPSPFVRSSTGSYIGYHRIELPTAEMSPGIVEVDAWIYYPGHGFSSKSSTRLEIKECAPEVSFDINSLPLKYTQTGPYGLEHVIELRQPLSQVSPQGMFMFFDIAESCNTCNSSNWDLSLVPRSGTGRSFPILYGPPYSSYIKIDESVAPGYYDITVSCNDGSSYIIPANIRYLGFTGYQSSGTLYNALTGNVIRGAAVSLWRYEEYPSTGYNYHSSMVAEDGTYSFDVPSGTYRLLVEYELGGEQWRGPFQVNSPIPYEDMYLSPVTDDLVPPVVTFEQTEFESHKRIAGTFRDDGVGISVVEVVPGTATNVNVIIPLYSNGDTDVPFMIDRLGDQPGRVQLRCIDQLGNTHIEEFSFSESSYGEISGNVVTSSAINLAGINIQLTDPDGNVLKSVGTIEDGSYTIDSIHSGDYVLGIIAPLGFSSTDEFQSVSVSGASVEINFELTEGESDKLKHIWWWKYYLSKLDEDAEFNGKLTIDDINTYGDIIFKHFYDRNDDFGIEIENVTFSGIPAAPLNFHKFVDIVVHESEESYEVKARKYLLTVMLNLASGRLNQTKEASQDGATISQAVTYLSQLYTINKDETTTEESMALRFVYITLRFILNEELVHAGKIPLTTPDVLYKGGLDILDQSMLPNKYVLYQNYPNPFNPSTEIMFAIPHASEIKIEVYNIIGQRVATLADGYYDAGTHIVTWDATNISSGIYLYRIEADEFLDNKKMLLLK